MQNISLFCIKVDSCSSSWLNGVSYDFQNEFKWNRTRDESGGWSIDASREARWSHHGSWYATVFIAQHCKVDS